MALQLESRNGSVTLVPEDGSGNVTLVVPRAGFGSGGGGYTQKVISNNTVLLANTEYDTGNGLVVLNGVVLQVPGSTKLNVRNFTSKVQL